MTKWRRKSLIPNSSINHFRFFRISRFMKIFFSKLSYFLTVWWKRHLPAPPPGGTFCHQRITYWRAWFLSSVTRYTLTRLNGLPATLQPELCCLKITFVKIYYFWKNPSLKEIKTIILTLSFHFTLYNVKGTRYNYKLTSFLLVLTLFQSLVDFYLSQKRIQLEMRDKKSYLRYDIILTIIMVQKQLLLQCTVGNL